MSKELLSEIDGHMVGKGEYYGNLRGPLLHGSEQFRQNIGVGGSDYYRSLLVSVDFSGRL